MLFETMNVIACGILMACLLPVVSVASLSRYPLHCLSVLLLVVLLFFQIAAPFWNISWWHPLPVLRWHTALLHMAVAAYVLIERKALWLYVRAKFDAPLPKACNTPMKRQEDIQSLMRHAAKE